MNREIANKVLRVFPLINTPLLSSFPLLRREWESSKGLVGNISLSPPYPLARRVEGRQRLISGH